MTFGFPQGLTKQDLSDAYFEHYQNDAAKYLAPVFVDNGPVFENIVQKDDVDIEKFPTPIWHRNDGGRYIGTGCYSVTMDPDEKWINAGCYRAMIQDKKTVSLLMVPGKHGYMHRQKYFRKGEKHADRAGARRRSAVFLHGRHRASLRRLRVRRRRRHARKAGGSGARQDHRAAVSGQFGDRLRRFSQQRQPQVRRTLRRVDRLLRLGRERPAGA